MNINYNCVSQFLSLSLPLSVFLRIFIVHSSSSSSQQPAVIALDSTIKKQQQKFLDVCGDNNLLRFSDSPKNRRELKNSV